MRPVFYCVSPKVHFVKKHYWVSNLLWPLHRGCFCELWQINYFILIVLVCISSGLSGDRPGKRKHYWVSNLLWPLHHALAYLRRGIPFWLSWWVEFRSVRRQTREVGALLNCESPQAFASCTCLSTQGHSILIALVSWVPVCQETDQGGDCPGELSSGLSGDRPGRWNNFSQQFGSQQSTVMWVCHWI